MQEMMMAEEQQKDNGQLGDHHFLNGCESKQKPRPKSFWDSETMGRTVYCRLKCLKGLKMYSDNKSVSWRYQTNRNITFP